MKKKISDKKICAKCRMCWDKDDKHCPRCGHPTPEVYAMHTEGMGIYEKTTLSTTWEQKNYTMYRIGVIAIVISTFVVIIYDQCFEVGFGGMFGYGIGLIISLAVLVFIPHGKIIIYERSS